MIVIRRIGRDRAADADLPNEAFALWGRMIPSLSDGRWDYRIEATEAGEDIFPDEKHDVGEAGAIFLGAYDGETCVGLAVLRKATFRYLYLDDLKVSAAWRGQGIGGALIEAGMEEARKLGLRGLYTVGQDNNASACLFYLKQGFSIGGFDNRAYRGTPQEHKADIYFYRDC